MFNFLVKAAVVAGISYGVGKIVQKYQLVDKAVELANAAITKVAVLIEEATADSGEKKEPTLDDLPEGTTLNQEQADAFMRQRAENDLASSAVRMQQRLEEAFGSVSDRLAGTLGRTTR
jgi:Na+-transporting NADH:ubiquinone oxidoreductase subunit NqrC